MNIELKYYQILSSLFITLLLCTNLMGTAKITSLWGHSFGSASLFFPLVYFMGAVLTEVYGYAAARKTYWIALQMILLAACFSWLVIALPASEQWPHQAALESLMGQNPRILGASLLAFIIGSFCNSFILVELSIMTENRWHLRRFIIALVLSEVIDSFLFFPLAFMGVWSNGLLLEVVLKTCLLKSIFAVILLPFLFFLTRHLKKVEPVPKSAFSGQLTPFIWD